MALIEIPPIALRTAALIPAEFVDDGCSKAPDFLFRVNLRWACRIHDWWWCTRAHPPGTMTDEYRQAGDAFLGAVIRYALSRHPLRHLAYTAYRWGPWFGWRGFNTCGPEAGARCRHNLPKPGWMGGTNDG
jgi:hypothetical protein